MKILRIITFNIALFNLICCNSIMVDLDNSNVTTISKVLHDIVDVFLTKQKLTFNINVFNKITRFQQEILTDFASNAGEKFRYFIMHDDLTRQEHQILIRSHIIFINSFYDFKYIDAFYGVFRRQNEPVKYFVFIPNITFDELKESSVYSHYTPLDVYSTSIFQNSYFITNEMETVTLSSVEWFSSQACNYPHLIKLNTFNKKSMTWTTKLENYEKFLNYHGCELVFMVPAATDDGVVLTVCGYAKPVKDSRKYSIHGISPIIFEIASKFNNFRPYYQIVVIDYQWFQKMEKRKIGLEEVNGKEYFFLIYDIFNLNLIII